MNRLPTNRYRASTYAAIDPNSIVPNVLNDTMITLLSMYLPMCALVHARAKLSKCRDLGSVQASPKISVPVFSEDRNVQAMGSRTSSAQIASATWPSPDSTRTSDLRLARWALGRPETRPGVDVDADASLVRMVVMSRSSELDALAPRYAHGQGRERQGQEEQRDPHRRGVAGLGVDEVVAVDLVGQHGGGTVRATLLDGEHLHQRERVEGRDAQVDPGDLDRVEQQRQGDPEEHAEPACAVQVRRLVDVLRDVRHAGGEEHHVEADGLPDEHAEDGP